jgi:hypothetical protein
MRAKRPRARPQRPAKVVAGGAAEAIAAYGMVGFEGDAAFDRGVAAQLRG